MLLWEEFTRRMQSMQRIIHCYVQLCTIECVLFSPSPRPANMVTHGKNKACIIYLY